VLGTCGANEVIDVRPLRGGWTSEMHAVALPGGRFVVLRELTVVVGFLPDPEKVAAPWRMAGRPERARRRLEAYLSSLRASASRS
jgi:hypothetical protein